MTKPMIQIHDAKSGEDVVREMTDAEFALWQAQSSQDVSTPTKEQLMNELASISAKIQALE